MSTTEPETPPNPNPIFDQLPFSSPEEWKETLEKFGANGRTFRDFTAISEESMEVFYMVAYNQYNAGKFEDAERVFRLLAMLNHFEKKYWKGLAASCEAQKKHEEALRAYGYLGIMDIEDPYPPFHAAKNFISLGKAPEAVSGLRAAVHNSENKPEHARLHAEAVGLLDLVEKAIKASQASNPVTS